MTSSDSNLIKPFCSESLKTFFSYKSFLIQNLGALNGSTLMISCKND